MADLPEKTTSDPSKPFFSRALEIAAWPFSGAIGWWWGNESARNSLYDTLKHTTYFKAKIRQPNWDNVRKIGDEGISLVERGIEASADIIKPLAQEHTRFDKETVAYFRKLGFNHTLDYLRGIHKNETLKAIMTGVGAGGIALGVITMLANHEGLQQLFSKKEKDDQTRSK